MQLYMYGETRSFDILKNVIDPGIFFVPCFQPYNDGRRTLIKAVPLIIDEPISTWCTKTSKIYDIPNISYETHKHIPLGTMFKDGVGCISSVLTYQYIV